MLLMLILSNVSALTCPTYSCKTANQSFSMQQCIYAAGTSYFLSSCQSKIVPYCQPSITNSTCTTSPVQETTGISWPGEACTTDSNCKYGICYQFHCNGQDFAMACTISDQCNPGLYCNPSGTCAFQLEVGKTGCQSDSDCVNNAGCNGGKCISYFSLPAARPIDTCQGNLNLLCVNSICQTSTTGNFCGSLVNSFTGTCKTSSDCVSTMDSALKVTYNSQCLCSYSDGSSYCTQLPGDSQYSDYLKRLKTWLANDIVRQCNTQRRTSSQCINLYFDDSDSLLLMKFYVQDYPMIKNNDQCTQTIFFQEYWQLYRKLNEVQNESI